MPDARPGASAPPARVVHFGLGHHQRHAAWKVRSGRLGSLKLGGHYRIPMEALRAFLAEQSKPVVPDAAS